MMCLEQSIANGKRKAAIALMSCGGQTPTIVNFPSCSAHNSSSSPDTAVKFHSD